MVLTDVRGYLQKFPKQLYTATTVGSLGRRLVTEFWPNINGYRHISAGLTRLSLCTSHVDIKVASFNILAPVYNRISGGDNRRESEFEDQYLNRNRRICDLLEQVDADVICIQEFWSSDRKLKNLFTDRLCRGLGYTLRELPRTSYWRPRDDGIAMFIKEKRIVLQDYQEIIFHDCGDRVAQLALLAVRTSPQTPHLPPQQFICVNTHLLFPHNNFSTNIRLREATKVLGFVEAYRQQELCSTICGRADVRLPVIIAGDFNGSPRGSVYKLVRSQNYRSSMEDFIQQQQRSSGNNHNSSSNSNSESVSVGSSIPEKMIQQFNVDGHSHSHSHGSDMEGANTNKGITTSTSSSTSPMLSWISHKSHRNKNVPVDHIFFLNPSEQVQERLPPVPDWTSLVFRELRSRLSQRLEARTAAISTTTTTTTTRSVTYGDESGPLSSNPTASVSVSVSSSSIGDSGVVTVTGGGVVAMEQERDPEFFRRVFAEFAQEDSHLLDREAFQAALARIGFCNEGEPALTSKEVEALVATVDLDGNGVIDYEEFMRRFLYAEYDEESSGIICDGGMFARSSWLKDKNKDITDTLTETETETGTDRLSNKAQLPRRTTTTIPAVTVPTPASQSTDNSTTSRTETVSGTSSLSSWLLDDNNGGDGSMTMTVQLPDARPMGDLRVLSVELFPEALGQGHWPGDYDLSDHGLLVVRFSGQALGPVPAEEVINPTPYAKKNN
eukprot:gene8789-18181_t